MFSKLIYVWHWLFPRGSIPASRLNAWKQCFPAILKSKINLSLWGKRSLVFFLLKVAHFLLGIPSEKSYVPIAMTRRQGGLQPSHLLSSSYVLLISHGLQITGWTRLLCGKYCLSLFTFSSFRGRQMFRSVSILIYTSRCNVHVWKEGSTLSCTYWVAEAPVLRRFQARGNAAEQRDKKEARVTAPGAKNLDLRGTDHCQSSHKILGFQCIGRSWSPVFSYRDPLLPSAAGMRRKLVLLAHYLLLCNSNLYLELKGENCTETVGIRVWRLITGSKEKAWATWPCKSPADQDEKH